MPNWVDIDFVVNGKKSELKKFREFARDENNVLSSDRFIPYPEKFKKMDEIAVKCNGIDFFGRHVKDGFNSGGYDWCCKNWGTKWGICNSTEASFTKNSLEYKFQTAWSPPTPIVVAMSKKFPRLVFKMDCYEAGACFHYYVVLKDGKIVDGKIVEEIDEEYSGTRGG